jgi:hypothetical protein
MLVTRVSGACPGCKAEAAFGNVSVSGNIFLRGCFHCKYSERLPLPVFSKEVLHLDQSFMSHAFRAELQDFVDAASLIGDLAHAQLIVGPHSSIHQPETHQWRHPQQQRFWEFIKRASRGHKFEAEYKVWRTQITRGFERFLAAENTAFPIESKDVLPPEIKDWDDYYWIDVPYSPDNVELTRELKKGSVED